MLCSSSEVALLWDSVGLRRAIGVRKDVSNSISSLQVQPCQLAITHHIYVRWAIQHTLWTYSYDYDDDGVDGVDDKDVVDENDDDGVDDDDNDGVDDNGDDDIHG